MLLLMLMNWVICLNYIMRINLLPRLPLFLGKNDFHFHYILILDPDLVNIAKRHVK